MSLKNFLVIEDHVTTTKGLIQELERLVPDAAFRSATSLDEAFASMKDWMPDLILLDLQLKRLTAMDHIQAIKKAAPTARVAIFSGLDDVSTMRSTLSRGADGFISKGYNEVQLREALEKLFENGFYYPPELLSAEEESVLSAREMVVLKLLSAGKSNKAMAKEMRIAPDTVKSHVLSIFRKLGVHNRTEAAREGRRRGFV